MSDLKNQIESLLFSAGKRLTLEELGRLCREENLDAVKAALEILKKELEDKHGSIMLVQEGESYKLTVREQYVSVVKKVVTTPELPKSILETLAVVAYKAPVMQSHVIKIRTNKAYRHLDELEELGYLTREKKGRSKLIKLTPKFFDYFDVPPDKLKEKFKNVAALEQAIEQKEQAIEQTQQNVAAAANDTTPRTEIVTEPLPTFAPGVEIVGGKVGELDTYGDAPKLKPKHKKKKHEAAAPATQEEAAEALAQQIMGEAGLGAEQGAEEATAEETAAMEEEGRLTVDKITQEAAQEKRHKSEYASKGMFPQGVPDDVKERIEHRVSEIVSGESAAAEENGEPSEVPETIPAPEEMTPEEDAASEAEPETAETAEEAPAEEIEAETAEEAPAEAEDETPEEVPEEENADATAERPHKKRKK
jgi:segregation and condensation protein B